MSLVITGNPGVGKHTIANKITKTLGYDIIDLNKIALEKGIVERKKETFDVDVKKLGKILKSLVTKKSLIVGHLAPYVLSKSEVKFAIVHRKNPYKLLSTYKKRKYSKAKMTENLESEILGIIAFDIIKKLGKKKTFQIDTSSKSILDVTKMIQKIVDGKKVNDEVDWLSLVSKKGDLKKFFSY